MTNNKASKRRRTPKGVLGRLIRTVFQFYPVLLPVTLICILINAIVSSIPSIFMQNVIAVVDDTFQSGDWGAASGKIISFLVILISLYIISLLAGVLYTQLMAIITQGTLAKMRKKMFNHMQDLPISYFDANTNGSLMSYYTNDIEATNELLQHSITQMLISVTSLTGTIAMMLTGGRRRR